MPFFQLFPRGEACIIFQPSGAYQEKIFKKTLLINSDAIDLVQDNPDSSKSIILRMRNGDQITLRDITLAEFKYFIREKLILGNFHFG